MSKPHKHAAVLTALANGTPIQWRNKGTDGGWNDIHVIFNNAMCDLVTGREDSCYEFRIKPTVLKYRRWLAFDAQDSEQEYVGIFHFDSGESPEEFVKAFDDGQRFIRWIDKDWQEEEV